LDIFYKLRNENDSSASLWLKEKGGILTGFRPLRSPRLDKLGDAAADHRQPHEKGQEGAYVGESQGWIGKQDVLNATLIDGQGELGGETRGADDNGENRHHSPQYYLRNS
jgi:hypothetical protein